MEKTDLATILLTTAISLVIAAPIQAQTMPAVEYAIGESDHALGEPGSVQQAAVSSGLETSGEQPAGADCACCPGPSWLVRADAMFIQRARPDDLVLMYDLADPNRNLNAESFDFDYEPGFDLGLRRQACWGGVEARFFMIDGWHAGAGLSGPPSEIVINNAVPFTASGVTSLDSTYSSELLNLELNLRRKLGGRVELIGGFRYLELDEQFHADFDAAAVITSYDTWTANRLYGGQVGAEATLWCRNRLTVDGLIKAGLFHNSGAQNTVYDSGAVIFRAADSSNRAALVGELAFTGRYCLTDSLSLRAAYQLLWVEDVVLATDQVPATDFSTGSGINPDGGAFYHGALVGLEYRR